MIKSFLKKVFSSASPSEANDRPVTAFSDEADAGLSLQPGHALPESVSEAFDRTLLYQTVTIKKEWLDKLQIDELVAMIDHLYETAHQFTELRRLRLRLEEGFQLDQDIVGKKRLGKFLDYCEQQVIDLTFFLDKKDPDTMKIYNVTLLPDRVYELNAFLRERCMMIAETCEGLHADYRKEIEEYVGALEISIADDFLEEFEKWRKEVLKRHAEEQSLNREEASATISVSETFDIKVSKEEVDNENIQQFDHFMQRALESPETAKEHCGTMTFSFYGFAQNDDLLDLMNRKEINDWASLLVEKHPYIFYFLNDAEYPMSRFLTSLVVSTEVEDEAVYYNEEELSAFMQYINDALIKLAGWLDEDEGQVLGKFERQFQ